MLNLDYVSMAQLERNPTVKGAFDRCRFDH